MTNYVKGGPSPHLNCSFCGKPSSDVAKLIAGPGCYICNECIRLCNEILAEDANDPSGSLTSWEDMETEDILKRVVVLADSRTVVEKAMKEPVAELRGRGVTWTRIGDALGITKQSAWERFSGED